MKLKTDLYLTNQPNEFLLNVAALLATMVEGLLQYIQ